MYLPLFFFWRSLHAGALCILKYIGASRSVLVGPQQCLFHRVYASFFFLFRQCFNIRDINILKYLAATKKCNYIIYSVNYC